MLYLRTKLYKYQKVFSGYSIDFIKKIAFRCKLDSNKARRKERNNFLRQFVLIIVLVLAAFPVAAKKRIYVVDGDSLFIGEREIRLSGIDAPEYHQSCLDADGEAYPCGQKSREALKSMINNSLECREVARDRYHRSVSVCFVDGEDINRQMAAQGWAVAYDRYTKDYVAAEREARRAKKGIWAGKFMRPELYRVLNR